MKLPRNEIGVSDLLAYRDCPRRMSAAMRRHTGTELAELTNESNAYGSALHEALHVLERDGLTDLQAIARAFKRYARFLDPADLARMKDDIAKYHERDEPLGYRTVLNEGEIRVKLMEYGGFTYYLRGRIDRLYQSLTEPGLFLHRDYKTSKWRKSEDEVDSDIQLWSYNLLIREYFPECERLVQHYDQLRHGVVTASPKSESQLEEIREWLQLAAIAVIDDEDYGSDGLLTPSFNEWCPWCAIKMDCPVVTREITRYTEATIKALAPVVPVLRKDGTLGKRTQIKLDVDLLDDYVRELPKVKRAKQTLEAFEKAVSSVLREMPDVTRSALGYGIRERTLTDWTPTALREVHDLVGDQFYELVGLTKTSVERTFGKESPTRSEIERLAEKSTGPASLYAQNED